MLTKNPFFILGITLRNNKEEITETFEQCVANKDYKESTLMHAQKNLLTSKARLEAEISWFPDLAPKKTQEIIDILQKTEDKKNADVNKLNERLIEIVQDLSGISQTNLISYLCTKLTGNIKILKKLIHASQDIAVETIKNAINANRKIARFPEISEQLVEYALKSLLDSYVKAAMQQITTFDHPGIIMTELIEEFVHATIDQKRFLEVITEHYDTWVIPKLRDFEDKIDNLIAKTQKNKKSYKKTMPEIITLLHQWNEYAQPSRLIFHSKGLDEQRSKKIFQRVRDLSLWLANERQEYNASLVLSKEFKKIFLQLPSVSNILDEDIGTLEDLIEQGKAQEDIEPLNTAVIESIKDEKVLLKSINKREFVPNGKGAAGKLYKTFVDVAKKTKGLSYEDEPWRLLLRLAIFLNNEKKQPFAAQEIIRTLCLMNPPESVRLMLQENSETIEANVLSNELDSVLKEEKLRRATEIIERLIIISKTEEDKQELKNLLVTIEDKKHSKWTNWIIYGIIILVLIGVKNQKSSTPTIHRISSQNNYAQDKTETPPSLESSTTLSLNELRWCLYQKKRIEFIQDQFPQNDYDSDYIRTYNTKLITKSIFNKYDALIVDFNSRCSRAKYHVSSKDIIEQEISESLIKESIKENAKNIMKTWDNGFLFKE